MIQLQLHICTKLSSTRFSASPSATVTTSTSFDLASSHARVTFVKSSKQHGVGLFVSHKGSQWSDSVPLKIRSPLQLALLALGANKPSSGLPSAVPWPWWAVYYAHTGQISQDGDKSQNVAFFHFSWSCTVTKYFDFFKFSQLIWRDFARCILIILSFCSKQFFLV